MEQEDNSLDTLLIEIAGLINEYPKAIERRAVWSVHGRAAFNICAVSCNGRPTTLL